MEVRLMWLMPWPVLVGVFVTLCLLFPPQFA